jgi:hypothetical protein
MIDQMGMHWTIRADEDAFASSSPELLADVLDSLFSGIREIGATDSGGNTLNAMQQLQMKKESGPKRIEREGLTLIYVVGETEDGRADFYDSSAVVAPLTSALEGLM